MSDKAEKQEETLTSPEEIQEKYDALRRENEEIQQKLAQLDGQKREHERVLEVLQPLEDDRKCMRAVGTVLIEKTVAEVKPALKENLKNLETIIGQITTAMDTKQAEIRDFVKKYEQANAGVAQKAAASNETRKEAASQGVLA
ncbi:putative prefoldin subunit 2 [Diplonema papillatum]|nr:putative prefoldin subunit 2 [Diplonema papillatum]|eukprot:gene20873-32195_t